ncbi:MAG: di-trans,poly-cis-decaprenylcistransferase [Thermoleophilaceae bacterium]|nr:di-trans,poly-cis-decaprenylcistransferase [Thermoleophilaceae bacterium]
MTETAPQRARCVAIIMDGNARWAQQRDLPVLDGHREGAQALKRTVKDAVRHDLHELTVFAFSTENWSRPEDEVRGLMAMFAELIRSETPELKEQGVRMRFIGRREGLSAELRDMMDWATGETAGQNRLKLYVAFNYGGRAELLDAARRFDGETEEEFAALLYAPDMSDPDLVIRTSGEHRLSNYLLWQTAYSELHFTDVLWPDFDEAALVTALREFESRGRRFGAR